MSEEKDFYTVSEAARLLRVSRSTVWRWVREGSVPAYRVGSRLRIPREGVARSAAEGAARMAKEDPRRPAAKKERARRRAAVEGVLAERQGTAPIAPLTAADLVRMGRGMDDDEIDEFLIRRALAPAARRPGGAWKAILRARPPAAEIERRRKILRRVLEDLPGNRIAPLNVVELIRSEREAMG